ncbi:MAG: hypothetical protein J3R72DRAFT_456002 [Linnemannia gamsii]|nr:MAG: hypothetical protein J3R72DRAFT_456002 [Linnemannia gamsii]
MKSMLALALLSYATATSCTNNLGWNDVWKFSAYNSQNCANIIGSWSHGACVQGKMTGCYTSSALQTKGIHSFMWLSTGFAKITMYNNADCTGTSFGPYSSNMLISAAGTETSVSSFKVNCA